MTCPACNGQMVKTVDEHGVWVKGWYHCTLCPAGAYSRPRDHLTVSEETVGEVPVVIPCHNRRGDA